MESLLFPTSSPRVYSMNLAYLYSSSLVAPPPPKDLPTCAQETTISYIVPLEATLAVLEFQISIEEVSSRWFVGEVCLL